MPRYLLKVEGRISGPFGEAALEEMASVRAFDEKALLAPEGTEAWPVLSQMHELCARCFPPKRKIELKTKAFEKVAEGNNEPVSIAKILQENLSAEAKLPPKPMPRLPNRRRRDFLFTLLFIAAVLGGLWYYLPHSKASDVGFGSAAVLCAFGTYWLFYQIMNRY